MHVPRVGHPLDILHHQLERRKVEGRHGVKRDIEQNQGPLEERVESIGYVLSVSRNPAGMSNRASTYRRELGGPCVE